MPLTAIAQMPRRIHIPSLRSVVCYGLPPLTPPHSLNTGKPLQLRTSLICRHYLVLIFTDDRKEFY